MPAPITRSSASANSGLDIPSSLPSDSRPPRRRPVGGALPTWTTSALRSSRPPAMSPRSGRWAVRRRRGRRASSRSSTPHRGATTGRPMRRRPLDRACRSAKQPALDAQAVACHRRVAGAGSQHGAARRRRLRDVARTAVTASFRSVRISGDRRWPVRRRSVGGAVDVDLQEVQPDRSADRRTAASYRHGATDRRVGRLTQDGQLAVRRRLSPRNASPLACTRHRNVLKPPWAQRHRETGVERQRHRWPRWRCAPLNVDVRARPMSRSAPGRSGPSARPFAGD